jgi:hypothetical protein
MTRKHNAIIPALLAALLAGCSGGNSTPGASGAAGPVVAATVGSATTYTSVKWGGGGYVTGLIYHPTTANLLYARTDIGGAYRWNPATSSWTPITDGIGFNGGESRFHGVESLALDPNNDQRVYLATGLYTFEGNGRLYASTDRGNTWTHYDLPFPVGGNNPARAIGERLAVDPNSPSTLFYGSRTAGLWKSTDSGQTWAQVTSLSTLQLTNDQVNTMGGWVTGVESLVFDTSTKGTGVATSTLYVAIAQDYANAAGLSSTFYKSVDGGATWTPVTVPAAVAGYYVPHMVRAADGTIYVAFSAGAGPGVAGPGYLYKLSGGTWTQIVSNSSAGYGGLSVYGSGPTARIALGVSNTWGSGQIVQLSVDGGSTWREIEQGMPHTPAGSSDWGWVDDIEIDPSNPDHISHIHGGGIVETSNATAATPSWNSAVTNLEETATLALVTPPAGAPYKFVNSAGDIGTWVQTDLAVQPTKGPSTAWSSGNAADVLWSDPTYIVGNGVINASNTAFGFWSGDGGNTWSNFAKLPTGASTNKGSTGSIVATSRGNVVWAPPNSVPSYTTNNGSRWSSTNLPALASLGWDRGYRLVADRMNAKKVYAYDSGGAFWGTPGKVYVSTDGGHHYTLSQGSVSANLAPNAYWITSMVVNPNAEGDLWLADGNTVYHSTDSGATWAALNGFATVAASGSTGALQGASAIALGKPLAGSSYSAAIYVVGTMNGVWGIYHSDDGGATWARFNDDAHQYGGVGQIAADWNTYGRIYFSGTGRGLVYTN